MIDMNAAAPERAAIEHFWERLVPGAPVILDDYGYAAGHQAQRAALDDLPRARMSASSPCRRDRDSSLSHRLRDDGSRTRSASLVDHDCHNIEQQRKFRRDAIESRYNAKLPASRDAVLSARSDRDRTVTRNDREWRHFAAHDRPGSDHRAAAKVRPVEQY
jgi:hypothetical protein